MKKILKIKLMALTILALSLFLGGTAASIAYANAATSPLSSQNDNRFDDGLRLHFIDVGQGDAAIIVLPSGQTIMIDSGGGNLAAPQIAVYRTVYAYLRRYIFPGTAPMNIDLFIATHSHADHIGTFDRLMPHMQIGHIVRPISFTPQEIEANIPYDVFDLEPPFAAHDTALFRRVVAQMALQEQSYGTLITIPYRGKTIDTFDCVDIRFYSPTGHYYGSSGGNARINPLSTIFSVTFEGRRMLFMGDSYVENEASILEFCEDGYTAFGTREGEFYDVDLIDIGHHGSTTSTSQAFLEKVRPSYAIIQVGTPPAQGGSPHGNDNTHGHPHTAVMNRLNAMGISVFRTDQEGNILVSISSDGAIFEVEGRGATSGGEADECCGDRGCLCVTDWGYDYCFVGCDCGDWCQHRDCDCWYCYGACACADSGCVLPFCGSMSIGGDIGGMMIVIGAIAVATVLAMMVSKNRKKQ